MNDVRTRFAVMTAFLAVAFVPLLAQAQGRQESNGVVLYWGVVPAAVVSAQHPGAMHGVNPSDGAQLHHLVVALYTAAGARISDAVVRGQLKEVGVVNAPPKYLTPMIINGQTSYGQYFQAVMSGPYHFHIQVKLANQPAEIEFTIDASLPRRNAP